MVALVLAVTASGGVGGHLQNTVTAQDDVSGILMERGQCRVTDGGVKRRHGH